MNINTPVSNLLSRNFIRVTPEISIERAEYLLVKKKVQYLIIDENAKFAGVVSQKDIDKFRDKFLLKNVSKDTVILRLRRHIVKDIMRTNLVVVPPHATLFEVCELYKSILFESAFIVEDNRLIGFLNSNFFEKQGRKKCSRRALTSY